MNCIEIDEVNLSSLELYDVIVKNCEKISKSLNISTEWVFIYFFSKNWRINYFASDFMKNHIYKPLET